MDTILVVSENTWVHRLSKKVCPPEFELKICPTYVESESFFDKNAVSVVFFDIEICQTLKDSFYIEKMFARYKPAIVFCVVESQYETFAMKFIDYGCDNLLLSTTTKKAFEKMLFSAEQSVCTLDVEYFPDSYSEIIGSSPKMMKVKSQIKRIASQNQNVLILGESGSGKSMIARFIHTLSDRKEGPFTAVNVAEIPESLFEAELFGSKKGAYTDSIDKGGLVAKAHKGTLFFDEIGTLPLPLQAKLLNVIEEKKYRRVGETDYKTSDFRCFSATNAGLKKMKDPSFFRSDLYYRIASDVLHLPPLRDHIEDLPLFSYDFFSKNNIEKVLNDSALDKLMAHKWPGNVRELFHVLEKASYLSQKSVIFPKDIVFP